MGILEKIEPATDRESLRCEGQVLRGQFLDRFARLETSLQQKLGALPKRQQPTAPVSQCLALLVKQQDQFQNAKSLSKLIAEIGALAAVRADIVHAVLEAVQVWDGKYESSFWQFRNVKDPKAAARRLTRDDFADLAKQASDLTNRVSQQQLKAPTPTAPASASE